MTHDVNTLTTKFIKNLVPITCISCGVLYKQSHDIIKNRDQS